MPDVSSPLPPGVCVLGLGLMGGSLLRATDDLLPASGWSPSAATRADAAAAGHRVHERIEDALAWADSTRSLVVLAAPTTAFDALLRKITALSPEALLTDIGSVKGAVALQVATIAPRTLYIGGHPMAGTAESGFGAGRADMFSGAAWVTCLQPNSHPDAWDVVAGMALAVGSRVVTSTPGEHDTAVARISHLPHLFALALSQVGEQGGPLAKTLVAGSFGDGTRVAGTRPELIRAMCESNRDALVDAFDDALGILGVARGTLASTGSLGKTVEAGHAAYSVMTTPVRQEPVELREPTVDDLLQLGRDGGVIDEVLRTPDSRTVRGTRPQSVAAG